MRNTRAQANAIRLRKTMTDAERRLWQHLRLRQMSGFKFRRQYPLGPYIADFACLEAQLIVEVDGGQHNDPSNGDAIRDDFMMASGYRVLRFWNDQVLSQTADVLEAIWQALRPPSCPSPASGGRDLESGDRTGEHDG